MAREYEKGGAFDSAVKRSPQGRLTVTTRDFALNKLSANKEGGLAVKLFKTGGSVPAEVQILSGVRDAVPD
jgi:hypothetical protein